jgi:hypothetical protein
MPNLTFRRRTLAQGRRSPSVTEVKAHELRLLLRMRYQSDQVQRSRGRPVWIERL